MDNNQNKGSKNIWSEREAENEKKAEKESLEKFNSITEKVKLENQNQTHNVRQEGISKINQKR